MTAHKLREAGKNVQQHQLIPCEKSAVLEEIYRVREIEERYEDEHIGRFIHIFYDRSV